MHVIPTSFRSPLPPPYTPHNTPSAPAPNSDGVRLTWFSSLTHLISMIGHPREAGHIYKKSKTRTFQSISRTSLLYAHTFRQAALHSQEQHHTEPHSDANDFEIASSLKAPQRQSDHRKCAPASAEAGSQELLDTATQVVSTRGSTFNPTDAFLLSRCILLRPATAPQPSAAGLSAWFRIGSADPSSVRTKDGENRKKHRWSSWAPQSCLLPSRARLDAK